jgi:hypothetical protein
MLTGQNKKSSARWSQTGLDETTVYGSSTDLWGQTWTDADINGGNFGLGISARGSAFEGTEDALVDNITITVHFTPAGASCTENAPLVEILDAPQTITADNGSVNYNVRITNQDVGAACTNPLTINLSRSDSNGNFTSSVPASVSLAPGANTTVVLQVTEQTAASGETTDTTVTATAAGHANGMDNVVTTYSLVPVCTANTPVLSINPSAQPVVAGATADYVVTVINTDTAACSATTFNLSVISDSNSADFDPSVLNPGVLVLNPGESAASTLTVSALIRGIGCVHAHGERTDQCS